MLNSASLRLRLLAGAALTVAIASPAVRARRRRPPPRIRAPRPRRRPRRSIQPRPAAAPDADPADQTGLGDIVVTATKRETNLQKTPIAISVLEQRGAEGPPRPEPVRPRRRRACPSLRVATFEARQSALTIGIRGIVPLDANQPAREQGVGIYIDGVYLGRQHGLNAALFDVERIEVLKGPQGTLFGRNTEGGALSIVTKAPTGEFGGRVDRAASATTAPTTATSTSTCPSSHDFSVKLDGVDPASGRDDQEPARGPDRLELLRPPGRPRRRALDSRSTASPTISRYDNARRREHAVLQPAAELQPERLRRRRRRPRRPTCVLPGTDYTTLTGSRSSRCCRASSSTATAA